MIRVGFGYDIHRFEDHPSQSQVVLGGVTIPHERGLIAHSDGDVVIHAICDALLGACALGDIGQHFPDTDPTYKNCNSRELLKQVWQKIHAQHYTVGNIDVTIIAQAPKILPHAAQMKKNIAADLHLGENDINIKATTNEGLDSLGQKQGIAVHAVALVLRASK